MEKVVQAKQNGFGRNRKKKLVVAGAALLGLGLATAGGYAALQSEADVLSGRFSSHKTEKVELYANGQKTAHLKGLSAKDMKAGDKTAPQSVTLSNKGNTDINSIVLKTSIPDSEDAKALAEVIDIEVTGGHGIVPTKVKHSLAEFVNGNVDLSKELGLQALTGDEKGKENITIKAVISQRFTDKHLGKALEQIHFRFVGTTDASHGQ
ncbi:hypothetical protein ACFYYS_01835 [Streptomyces sp. NPDC002120]|uniref:hypothetical protein n=1 Tax=Streptomyces sp. NPDC002120 TaxID=3364631 RepID=UPI003699EBB9